MGLKVERGIGHVNGVCDFSQNEDGQFDPRHGAVAVDGEAGFVTTGSKTTVPF